MFITQRHRFDYLMADPDDTFFKELVEYHVSGQLKVAPEHCAPIHWPPWASLHPDRLNKFKTKFYELSKKAGKSGTSCPMSHAGQHLSDAVYLAGVSTKTTCCAPSRCRFYPPRHGGTCTVLHRP